MAKPDEEHGGHHPAMLVLMLGVKKKKKDGQRAEGGRATRRLDRPARVRRNPEIAREAREEGESYEEEAREHGRSEGGRAYGARFAEGGSPEKWIQESGVDRNKGGLHRALRVPEGEPIPARKLSKALHSENRHVRHMAQFAKNVKG